MTTVVHCLRDTYDVYIGRAVPRKGYLHHSRFANPFRIDRDGTREEVIAKFRGWVINHPVMVAQIRRELRGKRLGCWCAPKACHGDVLAEIADQED